MNIELTKSQVLNLVEFIELNLVDSIKNDPDIDNVDYIVDMATTLTKLRTAISELPRHPYFENGTQKKYEV